MSDRSGQATPLASGSFRCRLCKKTYAARSSYVRHSKQCGLERSTGPPRQKSCKQCSKAKTRCDQRHPICSRCMSRNDKCDYATNSYLQHSRSGSQASEVQFHHDGIPDIQPIDVSTQSLEPDLANTSCSPDLISRDSQSNLLSRPTEIPSFKANVSISNNNFGDIRDRWLYPYVEDSPAKHTVLNHSMEYLCRVLRTYPKMMSRREQVPPIIHPMQVSTGDIALPLTNCFTLAKMWEGSAEPAGALIEQTIKREMERLFNEYRTYNQQTLIAAFQALLIYCIILLFPTPQKPSPGTFNQVTLVSLQDVGYFVSQTSLVLEAENTHSRPSWDEWVLVSAKRRTIMALYLFEWMYARLNALPTYPCFEIGFMPAPAGNVLWGGRTRQEWESAYDRLLGRWTKDGFYKLKELGQVRPGPEIDARTEMWLEEADEFGMMYMALVNATEGYLSLVNDQTP